MARVLPPVRRDVRVGGGRARGEADPRGFKRAVAAAEEGILEEVEDG